MPKNSSADILRRWQAMDAMLTRGRLFVASFARKWNVSMRTVKRDLNAFEELGQRVKRGYEWEIAEHYWRYVAGQRPLFTASELKRSDGSEGKRRRK
jgi:hypothetical protein